MRAYELSELIYENPLAGEANVKGFQLEGQGEITFPNGRMRMANILDPSLGQKANFVFWCPEDFPPDIAISWDFSVVREPGLAMIFCAATGIHGESIFDPRLASRTGPSDQYGHGDINALHLSYYRLSAPDEMAFRVCVLRKSHGYNFLTRGADPIPLVQHADPPYHIELVKCGPDISFSINDLPILSWTDDGETFGPVYGGGKIGFRQMAPLIAEYANLRVHKVVASE